MKTNVKALQDLYVALGGDIDDVAECSTIVEVLNAIAAKFSGSDNATLNPDAIDNITAVAENIIGTTPTGATTITTNGTHDVTNYATAEVSVPTSLPTSTVSVVKQLVSTVSPEEITIKYTNSSGEMTTLAVDEERTELLDVAKGTMIFASMATTGFEVSETGSVSAYAGDGNEIVALLVVGDDSHYTITFNQLD